MNYIMSIAYFLVFIAFGGLTAQYLFREEGRAVRVMLALTFSLTALMWFPALFAFLFDFTLTALYCALALAVLTGALFFILRIRRHTAGAVRPEGFLEGGVPSFKGVISVILPVLLFAFTMYLLNTHILKPNVGGALETGQSTYGDLAMHLSFITSISEQKTFPPNYNLIATETPLGYPFLCDSVSSVFYSITGALRFSYNLPVVVAIAIVFIAVYLFFNAWLKDNRKSIVGWLLFFIGGGFGFAYFFDELRVNPGNLARIFNAFYNTPTNYTTKNILWVNPIADMMIPQRSTLFGWSVLIPCLYLLYRAAFDGKREYFIPLGVLAGSLPLVNTHSFLALGLVSAVYFLRALFKRDAIPHWLLYAGTALILALPQLVFFTFRQAVGDTFLRVHLNWVNSADNYFWFYIKNLGLQSILAVPAFLNAEGHKKWLYCGGLFTFAIAEILVFQPNVYDNNKLIFVWYLLNCGLVADFLLDMYRRLSDMRGIKTLAVIILTAMNLSGLLTLGREGVSKYELFGSHHVKAAEFIKSDTSPDSLFLTNSNHNNAVASLTGRNIFLGSSSYLYYHGIDTTEETYLLRELFENPGSNRHEYVSYGIDYVYLSDYERSNFQVDYAYFESSFEKVYDMGGVIIYSTGFKSERTALQSTVQ